MASVELKGKVGVVDKTFLNNKYYLDHFLIFASNNAEQQQCRMIVGLNSLMIEEIGRQLKLSNLDDKYRILKCLESAGFNLVIA